MPDTSLKGAGSGKWRLFGISVVNLEDVLPSRGEQVSEGMTTARRPARVRMLYREGITPDMRFVMGDRIMQIVGGPAELGFREGLEFMVEDYRPAGNPA
ncbi:head-tail adaptor protein [Sphingomonas sp. VDB2]|uniref:head-tail adaptor protein n=1 Tax=Sphingomonas sp. VDB2 TaxID=3228751 RepID=UPI003A7F62D7